jgi:hypothetical protein
LEHLKEGAVKGNEILSYESVPGLNVLIDRELEQGADGIIGVKGKSKARNPSVRNRWGTKLKPPSMRLRRWGLRILFLIMACLLLLMIARYKGGARGKSIGS